MTKLFGSFLFNFIFVLRWKVSDQISTAEKSLFAKLLADYSNDILPPHNGTMASPTVVNISLGLAQILDMDERNEIMKSIFWIGMKWNDLRFAWQPSNHGNVQELSMPATEIWIPDILLYNTNDIATGFHIGIPNNDDDQNLYALTDYTGKVQLHFPAIFQSTCKMDIGEYPFDDQFCKLELGPWSHDNKEIMLSLTPDNIDISAYITKNKAWQLRKTYCHTEDIQCSFDHSGTRKCSVLWCSLHLRRRAIFEIINYTIPTIVIAVCSLMVFLVPPEAGKRMEVGITLILCLAVYLSLVNKKMPSTSEAFPLVTKFYGCVIIELTVAMICSCYCLHIYDPEGLRLYRFPRNLRIISYSVLARIVCFGRAYAGKGNRIAPVTLPEDTDVKDKKDKNNKSQAKEIKETVEIVTLSQIAKSKQLNSNDLRTKETRCDSGFGETDSNDSRPPFSKSSSNVSTSSFNSAVSSESSKTPKLDTNKIVPIERIGTKKESKEESRDRHQPNKSSPQESKDNSKNKTTDKVKESKDKTERNPNKAAKERYKEDSKTKSSSNSKERFEDKTKERSRKESKQQSKSRKKTDDKRPEPREEKLKVESKPGRDSERERKDARQKREATTSEVAVKETKTKEGADKKKRKSENKKQSGSKSMSTLHPNAKDEKPERASRSRSRSRSRSKDRHRRSSSHESPRSEARLETSPPANQSKRLKAKRLSVDVASTRRSFDSFHGDLENKSKKDRSCDKSKMAENSNGNKNNNSKDNTNSKTENKENVSSNNKKNPDISIKTAPKAKWKKVAKSTKTNYALRSQMIFGRILDPKDSNPLVAIGRILKREQRKLAFQTEWMCCAMIFNRFFIILLGFAVLISMLAVFMQSSRIRGESL